MTFHNIHHEGTPLELKSEAEDHEDGAAADVVAALDGIRADLGARLEKLETKSASLEKRLARPALGGLETKTAEPIERKAFKSYLRAGEQRMQPDETKALIAGTDAVGGYLAPPEFGAEVLKLLREFSPIRQYARVVPISAGEIRYPVRQVGAVAQWVGELEGRSESTPGYQQLPVKVFELGTFIDVSNALLEDNAYNLENELALEFADAFAKAESTAFVTGSGVKQPRGLFTSPSITSEVKTGQANGFKVTNPTDNLLDLFHLLPTAHAQNAVWLMNRNTMNVLRHFKDNDGRYLLANPIAEKMPSTIFGRPVVECVDAPDIAANATPIMFGDLQGYRIFDRVDLQVMRDPYSRAFNGLVEFHARRRVGADVTHPDRFARLKVAS